MSPEAQAVYEDLVRGKNEPDARGRKILEAYAATCARAATARAAVDRDGAVIADAKGQPVQHPALAVERQAMDDMRKWDDSVKAVLRAL